MSTATAALSFLVAFGLAKAVTNLAAGAFADRVGRKPVLVAGWLVGVPVPFILIVAPDWTWVVIANVLLGVNQGMTWSTTVLMKVDLVGPRNRGLALGINEAAGYLAVAAVAFLTGAIAEAAGLRPAPFFLGLAIAGLGLGVSTLFVRETHAHALLEAGAAGEAASAADAALAAARVAQQRHRSIAVGGVPGRPGQQPQRRAGLGPAAARPGSGRALASARSASWPPPIRRRGASARSRRVRSRTGSVESA